MEEMAGLKIRIVLMCILLFVVGISTGMLIAGHSVGDRRIRIQTGYCLPCPQEIQMQCVHDLWDPMYIAGKCGKK